MPQPMTQPDGPRHAERTPSSTDGGRRGTPNVPDATGPRADLAMSLPPWDLLPPAEFVRRRRS
jgi:hypothetical protein